MRSLHCVREAARRALAFSEHSCAYTHTQTHSHKQTHIHTHTHTPPHTHTHRETDTQTETYTQTPSAQAHTQEQMEERIRLVGRSQTSSVLGLDKRVRMTWVTWRRQHRK